MKIISLTLLLILFVPTSNLLVSKAASAESKNTYSVKISKRQVVGKNKIQIFYGDTITLLWQTDENVELHLHGLDIKKTVITDKITPMLIKARATGRFPVTSHGFSGEKKHTHGKGALFYIEVHPK